MDISMPEMDGIEAARRIRKLGEYQANVPIIALTANAIKGDRDRYLEAGMNDYVSKPIDELELQRVIARHCGVDSVTGTTIVPGPGQTATSTEAQEDLAGLLDSLDEVVGKSG
jgi:CheY-like chemotaxis protein